MSDTFPAGLLRLKAKAAAKRVRRPEKMTQGGVQDSYA
jgi:hypothetical protein